jgi:hypothetical protein
VVGCCEYGNELEVSINAFEDPLFPQEGLCSTELISILNQIIESIMAHSVCSLLVHRDEHKIFNCL